MSVSCVSCAAATWGVFGANQITATGRPVNPLPNILGSTSFKHLKAEGGRDPEAIFVTSQGNTDVNSLWFQQLHIQFLASVVGSVTKKTFIDTANGLFTTTWGHGDPALGNTLFKRDRNQHSIFLR